MRVLRETREVMTLIEWHAVVHGDPVRALREAREKQCQSHGMEVS